MASSKKAARKNAAHKGKAKAQASRAKRPAAKAKAPARAAKPKQAAKAKAAKAKAAKAPARTEAAAPPTATAAQDPAAAPNAARDPVGLSRLVSGPTGAHAASIGGSPALPQRLFLHLDSRGLDGVGLPVEVIDLPCVLGSARNSSVWINSPQIETRHAQITQGEDGWVLEDLGSEHGTFLDGQRIGRRVLQNGDIFQLAGYLRLKAELR